MDWSKALRRIWRTWKYGFVIAIFVYAIVFWWGFNYEVHRQEEPEYSEEPLEIFDVSIYPPLSDGIKEYKVNVTNREKYTIKELIIEFRGTRLTKPDDFIETQNDRVGVGGEVRFINMVSQGAVGIDIILDGQEVVAGRTNINLDLQSYNNSNTWSSSNQGNYEEIHLNQDDIHHGGFGEYAAIVKHDAGFRAVEFQLTFRITYSQIITSITVTDPIAPSEGIELSFLLNIESTQLEDVICYIHSRVELVENLILNLEFEYDHTWILIRESRPIPQEHSEEIPWGPVDMTGTSSAVLYSITIIGGFAVFIRTRFTEIALPVFVRKAHCFIALITLMFELAHITIALQKAWPWLTPGLIFAYAGIGTLAIFVIFSFFDIEIIRAYGREKWRQMHLIITFVLALLIILHFGLMGDHLGFLKGLL
jgi:hypothetical protein